jgi:hypothetical protein
LQALSADSPFEQFSARNRENALRILSPNLQLVHFFVSETRRWTGF